MYTKRRPCLLNIGYSHYNRDETEREHQGSQSVTWLTCRFSGRSLSNQWFRSVYFDKLHWQTTQRKLLMFHDHADLLQTFTAVPQIMPLKIKNRQWHYWQYSVALQRWGVGLWSHFSPSRRRREKAQTSFNKLTLPVSFVEGRERRRNRFPCLFTVYPHNMGSNHSGFHSKHTVLCFGALWYSQLILS